MRPGGIEPPPTAWEAAMIPFHHGRKNDLVTLRENFTTKLQGLEHGPLPRIERGPFPNKEDKPRRQNSNTLLPRN